LEIISGSVFRIVGYRSLGRFKEEAIGITREITFAQLPKVLSDYCRKVTAFRNPMRQKHEDIVCLRGEDLTRTIELN
jgi:hypothetical protein